jgi:ligand-binding sensor domain-containing protein
MPTLSRSLKFSRACLLAALTCSCAFAVDPNHKLTQYLHRIYQAQPGLPQSSIYAVTQTHDGYLWLGTQSGVVRFDGERFTPVRALQDAGFGDVWARAIEEDTNGNIWLTANDFSLIRVTRNGAKQLTEKDGLPTKDFSCLVPGPQGEMWACTATGLVRFQGERIDSYQAPETIVNRPIDGCRADDGTIWVGGGNVLASWNGSGFSRVNFRTLAGDLGIRALLCSGDTVWVASLKGLIQMRGGHETVYTTRDGLLDDSVTALAQGKDGVWIGTRSGFSRLINGKIESYGYRDGLSASSVYALAEDREGCLWVATRNGLNQFLDGAATRYTKSEGLPGENMGPVFQDHRGRIWTGSLDGGLFQFDGRRFVPIPSAGSDPVSTLAETLDGSLWIGTSRGVKQLWGTRVVSTYTTADGLPSNEVRMLFRDQSGQLWAATSKGPAVFRRGRFVELPELKPLALPIAAIGETREGAMLFAVERGSVYVFSGGDLRTLGIPAGSFALPLEDVTSFYTDRDGAVWMGTNGFGLVILQGPKLNRILVRDGLFDSEIYGFVRDLQDRLWMACGKGFFWVNRADLLKFADGKLKKVTSEPYSPLDGLRTIQGTPRVSPAGMRAQDGRLWFSATGWILAFAPDLGIRPGPPPPVLVEETTVNGATMDPDDFKTLAPGQYSVAFHYTALTFLAPQRMNFRYILEGYDKAWTDAGPRREAFYTNLPPGKYRFRVSACGAFVLCNETANALEFEIAPYFYQRVWFIPACILALGLAIFIAHQLRIRELRSHFVLILNERSRIARELHDTLIQGFSGITMQLQAFATRLRSPEDQQALNEIIRDAGICLQETRRSVAGLRSGAGASSGLGIAIRDAVTQATEGHDIRLKLDLDDGQLELSAEVKYNLLCIVQEAVGNCVKHAGARNLEVSLARSSDGLTLSIRDDGRGFRPAQSKPGHYGLIGMKERAHHIGAECEISSVPGSGAEVIVRLPVGRDAHVAPIGEKLETIG